MITITITIDHHNKEFSDEMIIDCSIIEKEGTKACNAEILVSLGIKEHINKLLDSIMTKKFSSTSVEHLNS